MALRNKPYGHIPIGASNELNNQQFGIDVWKTFLAGHTLDSYQFNPIMCDKSSCNEGYLTEISRLVVFKCDEGQKT